MVYITLYKVQNDLTSGYGMKNSNLTKKLNKWNLPRNKNPLRRRRFKLSESILWYELFSLT